MAKKRTKVTERKDTRSRQVLDLPAKPVGVRKAASARGGAKLDFGISKVDKSSDVSF
jgi:hypothetical protein